MPVAAPPSLRWCGSNDNPLGPKLLSGTAPSGETPFRGGRVPECVQALAAQEGISSGAEGGKGLLPSRMSQLDKVLKERAGEGSARRCATGIAD